MLRKLYNYLDLIKFHHTVFALPFAVISAFYASGGIPSTGKIILILAAMTGARSSAMAFNRIIDLKYDRKNPRTAQRHLVTGSVSIRSAVIMVIFSILIFITSAYMLNPLCFYLSPVALLVILGYSYTKRFTSMSHFILGLSLGIAPVGAWIAVAGGFAAFPIFLSTFVVLWTAGFDIIYSTMDVDFDRNSGLFSIPRRIGLKKALFLSSFLHLLAVGVLVSIIPVFHLGWYFRAACVVTGFILIYEHAIINENDLKRANKAFFHANAAISVIIMSGALLELFIY